MEVIRGRRGLVGMCVMAAVAIGGCGGGDDADDVEESVAQQSLPEASQPIEEQIPVFERAAADVNCEDALEVAHTVLLEQSDRPDTPQHCGDATYGLRRIPGFEAGASEEYGTAAVVDGTVGGAELSTLWALDSDDRYKWTGSIIDRPEVGTAPPSDVDFATTARDFVDAIREDDCRAAFALLQPDSRLGYGDAGSFCDQFEATFFAAPESFGSRLRGDPEAQPVEMGGTRDYAFLGVATEPAGYRTLMLQSSDGEARVLDVVPAEL